MKKLFKLLNVVIVVSVIIILNSCSITQRSVVIPAAINSISEPVQLDYLNLTKDSYQILKTETVESVIVYEEKGSGAAKKIIISEKNDEFVLEFKQNPTTGGYDITHSGVVKVGYLSQSDSFINYYEPSPAAFARGLAAYRLINSVQDQGADGIIEPVVTMKVGQEGKKLIFTAVISAKMIKIKTK